MFVPFFASLRSPRCTFCPARVQYLSSFPLHGIYSFLLFLSQHISESLVPVNLTLTYHASCSSCPLCFLCYTKLLYLTYLPSSFLTFSDTQSNHPHFLPRYFIPGPNDNFHINFPCLICPLMSFYILTVVVCSNSFQVNRC